MNVGTLFRLLIGLAIALVFSALLTLPLSHLPGLYGEFSPLAVTVLLCGLGMWIMVIRGEDLLELLGFRLPAYSTLGKRVASQNGQILVDTSTIIDGRIADIGRTGCITPQS